MAFRCHGWFCPMAGEIRVEGRHHQGGGASAPDEKLGLLERSVTLGKPAREAQQRHLAQDEPVEDFLLGFPATVADG